MHLNLRQPPLPHRRRDPLDGEALPRIPPSPADVAVAERLHRSTGELTAWEIAHPADDVAAAGHAIGI